MTPDEGAARPTGQHSPARSQAGTSAGSRSAREHVSWFVPGRIEVLGKHTDYAGGRSLLAAADVGITFVARRTDEPRVRVHSTSVDDEISLPLQPEQRVARGHWAGYPAAVISRLTANFPGRVPGADVDIDSSLPLASGMSSSSAMVVGLARCLMDLGGLEDDPRLRTEVSSSEQLAHYLACVENGMSFGSLTGNRGVGTFGGSEDHTAMLCARPDALVQYAFSPARREAVVPFPRELSFVVAVSGVLAEKTGAAMELYNRASLATREIVARWNEATGRQDAFLAAAVRADDDAPARLRQLTRDDGYLRGRLEQFMSESERFVPAAAAALTDGHLAEFGEIVDESQRWSEEGLGNQVPETVHLQRSARQLGALAASAFGAGFGGSVWALVPSDHAADFSYHWLEEYRRAYPTCAAAAQILTTRPGNAAHRLGE